MVIDSMKICDVCGSSSTGVVRSSRLGPASFYYCDKCVAKGAEPFGVSAVYLKLHDLDDEASEKITWKNGNYITLLQLREGHQEDVEKAFAEFQEIIRP